MNLLKAWRGLFARDKTSGLLRPSIPVRESWESHGLTDVQKARLREYLERYTRIALCTDEADWDTFETGARQCYKYAGLQQPKTFIRVQSPAVLALAAPIATAAIEMLREEWVRPGQEWNASLVKKQTAPPRPAHVRRALRSTIDSMGLANDPLAGRLRQEVKEAIDHAVGTATGSEAWASAPCGESPLDYGDRRIQYKTEASALNAFERTAVTRAGPSRSVIRSTTDCVSASSCTRTTPTTPERP